jgi:chromosome segregation ATPase
MDSKSIHSVPKLIIEETDFSFSEQNTSSRSFDDLDRLQNTLELESHIHNLKGTNVQYEMEIKKLKEQNKLLRKTNIQEEIKNKEIKEQYMEVLEQIKKLHDQIDHSEKGNVKIKELNKSLQEQYNHTEIGIAKLKEMIKTYQEKLSLYELEIQKLNEMHENDIIEIKRLQNQITNPYMLEDKVENTGCCL